MSRGPSDFYVELGRRLRLARVQKRLSQQQAAAHIGVTFQQLQKYEKGTNRLGAEYLVRLRELYKVPLGDLLPAADTGAGEPHGMSKRALRLVSDFERIGSEQVRQHLATLVRSLARTGHTDDGRTQHALHESGHPPRRRE